MTSSIFFLNGSDCITGKCDDVEQVVLSISKGDIWSLDIEHVSALLLQLSNNTNLFKRMNGKLTIVFAGFTNSYKELSSVPQVVQFVKRVFEKWPYFLHFLSHKNKCLTLFLAILSIKDEYDLGAGNILPVIHANTPVLVDLLEGPQKLNNSYEVFDPISYQTQLENKLLAFFPTSRGL